MAIVAPLPTQPDLFGDADPRPGPPPDGRGRLELAEGAWVDHHPDWLAGHDALFAQLVPVLPWAQPEVTMYERRLAQPRLSAHWRIAEPPVGVPVVVAEVARVLGPAYGEELATVGANLYRDGADSVAWHGDRIGRERTDALVAIVSLGGRRPFCLRPRGGGRAVRFDLRGGDLLVMGGSCQRTWQHCVPKVARADARLSLSFRAVWG